MRKIDGIAKYDKNLSDWEFKNAINANNN